MFNDNFYPTPSELGERLLSGIKIHYYDSILEPSAGKGDLIESIYKKYNSKGSYTDNVELNIDCIESEPQLQQLLKSQHHPVIHNDFLTFSTYKHYDLIIMNPPFDNGVLHILKAIDLLKNNGGGTVACILNAATITNVCDNNRKILQDYIREYDADVEFVKDGFKNAERKTNVEVALVRLTVPDNIGNEDSFIWSDTLKKAIEREDSHFDENEATYSLTDKNFFETIVKQYNMEIECGINFMKEYYSMTKNFLTNEDDYYKSRSELKLCLGRDDSTPSVNKYIESVRSKYWKTLFNRPGFVGRLTGNLRKSFMSKLNTLKHYDFSLYNIYQLQEDMSKQVIDGIEDSILSLFESLTNEYHYYDETSSNKHLFNGWKTNKAYIINKKVILPLNMFEFGYSTNGKKFNPFVYHNHERLKDIEKVFNYLDGGLTDAVDMDDQLKKAHEEGRTKNIELKYFTITFYKKGTAHLVFNNDELLKKFNIFGSQKKGWLPPCYGKKNYSEMSEEEKNVIDSFEGEASYCQTMNQKDYYITDSSSLLMIEGKNE